MVCAYPCKKHWFFLNQIFNKSIIVFWRYFTCFLWFYTFLSIGKIKKSLKMIILSHSDKLSCYDFHLKWKRWSFSFSCKQLVHKQPASDVVLVSLFDLWIDFTHLSVFSIVNFEQVSSMSKELTIFSFGWILM